MDISKYYSPAWSAHMITSGMIHAHYAAESLSWYSRDRAKQLWMPLSPHNRLITLASSSGRMPCSSAAADRANSCWASSCSPTETRYTRRVPDERLKYSVLLIFLKMYYGCLSGAGG